LIQILEKVDPNFRFIFYEVNLKCFAPLLKVDEVNEVNLKCFAPLLKVDEVNEVNLKCFAPLF